MRLLYRRDDSHLGLTEFLDDAELPRFQYAILSHTWGNDEDEVKFEDISDGSARTKAGYKKIEYCGEQAARDGILYWWVDSCCIKKSSDAELSQSLNSMFRWYRNAAQCYVYMADVPESSRPTWEASFRSSRWFTRGWTLQELLAPAKVEFFSSNWQSVGNKDSLKLLINEITGIAIQALMGIPLSKFTIAEREQWAAKRVTKKEEDEAYCMFGIFGISMAPRYGEGKENAWKRLHNKINKTNKTSSGHMETPVSPDSPGISEILEAVDFELEMDKIGYERCPNTGNWLLNDQEYNRFINTGGSTCFHLCGKPGAGKSFLTANVIDQLRTSTADSSNTSLGYFLCNAKTEAFNRRTSISILQTIVAQQLDIIQKTNPGFVRTNLAAITTIKRKTKEVPIGQLIRILEKCLQQFDTWYLVIDAVDECDDWKNLLQILIDLLQPNMCTLKLFLSSRPGMSIPYMISRLPASQVYQLDVTEQRIQSDIVRYVERRIGTIDVRTLGPREHARDLLMSGCDGLFLLIRLRLDFLSSEILPRSADITHILSNLPSEIFSIYERLLAKLDDRHRSIAQMLFVWVVHARRPITISELSEIYREEFGDVSNGEGTAFTSQEIEDLTGGLIEIHQGLARIIHATVREFSSLCDWGKQSIIPDMNDQHFINMRLVSRCIGYIETPSMVSEIMAVGEIPEDFPEKWPLANYAIHFWVVHLRLSSGNDALAKRVLNFMKSDAALAWWIYYTGQVKIHDWWTFPEVSADIAAWFHSNSEGSDSVTIAANIMRSLCQRHVALLETHLVSFKPHLFVQALIRLAGEESDIGNLVEAESLLRRAVTQSEKASSAHEGLQSCQAMLDLSKVLAQEGRHGEAKDLCFKVQSLAEKLGDDGLRPWISATKLIGEFKYDFGKYDEAEQVLRDLLNKAEKAFGRNDPDTLSVTNALGITFEKLGKYEEARELSDVQYFKSVLGEHHPSTLTGYENYAALIRRRGKVAESIDILVNVRQLRQTKQSNLSTDIIRTEISLAYSWMQLGKSTDALESLQRLYRTTLARLGNDHFLVCDLRSALAEAHGMLGNYLLAEELKYEVVETMKRRLGEAHRWVSDAVISLAITKSTQGNYGAAADLLLAAKEVHDDCCATDVIQLCDILFELLKVKRSQGMLCDATLLGERLIALRRSIYDDHGLPLLDVMAEHARTLKLRGRIHDAMSLEEQVLDIRKQTSGEDSPEVLLAVSRLAWTKLSLGRMEEAEMLQTQVLESKRRNCEEDSLDVIAALENLALTKRDRGDLRGAAQMQEQVLGLREKVEGKKSMNITVSMGYLAVTRRNQGKLDDAERLQEEVLERYKMFGNKDRPDILDATASLASTKRSLKKLKEAEELEEHVLQRRKETEDENSPGILTAMGNLALTKKELGKLQEAEKLQEDVVQRRKETEDGGSPNTLTAMGNLALTKGELGKLQEAERLQEDVLQYRKQTEDEDSWSMITAMGDLASTKRDRYKLVEAEDLEELVLQRRRESKGTDSPDTLTAIRNLALTKQDRGKLREAEKLHEELLGHHRKAGRAENSREILQTLASLAQIKQNRGDLETAEQMQSQVLQLHKENASSSNTLDITAAMGELATTKRLGGSLEDAETLQEQVVQLCKEATGDERSPPVLSAMLHLARTKRERGNPAEAEMLEQHVFDCRKQIEDHDSPNVVEAMRNLALSKHARGNLEEAEALLRDVIKIQESHYDESSSTFLYSIGALAATLVDRREFEEADILYTRVIDQFEALGDEPKADLFVALENLALSKQDQNKLEEVEVLRERILALRKKAEGDENSLPVVKAIEQLALTKYERGQLIEAEKLQEHVLENYERIQPGQRTILEAMRNLANFKRDLEKFEEAGRIQEQVLEILQVDLQAEIQTELDIDDATLVLRSIYELAWIRAEQERSDEAEQLYERQLEMHEMYESASHMCQTNAMGNLGVIKGLKGKYIEAERLFQREVNLRTEQARNRPSSAVEDKDLQQAVESLSIVQEMVSYEMR